MNFEKEFKALEQSQVELSVTIKKNDVKNHYEELLKKYTKQIQIPGFRKGKVPLPVLEQKYGSAIKEEATGELIEEVLEDTFKNANEYERPLPYAQPEMGEKPELDLDKDFSFTVKYDVFPKAELKKVEGFTLAVPEVKIAASDIEKELETLQERNAIVIDRTDGDAAEKNNVITINYSELDENNETIVGTERQDFVFTIGSGQNIYKIDDDIIGMKKGETKDITKTYAEDFEDSTLAGTTKKIRVTATALKRKDLPAIDDELAQDISEKYKTLDDLKADITKKLEATVENKIKSKKINLLLEQMIEANPIVLPESMIRAELESRWQMLARQFGIDPQQLQQLMGATERSKEATLEEWKPEAEKMLKSRVIVEVLMKDRDITTNPEEFEAECKKIAAIKNVSEEDVKKHYENPREKEYLIDEIKEQKLYEQLFEKCTLTKGEKLSLEKLFDDGHAHD